MKEKQKKFIAKHRKGNERDDEVLFRLASMGGDFTDNGWVEKGAEEREKRSKQPDFSAFIPDSSKNKGFFEKVGLKG